MAQAQTEYALYTFIGCPEPQRGQAELAEAREMGHHWKLPRAG